jgi:hypothetical protein
VTNNDLQNISQKICSLSVKSRVDDDIVTQTVSNNKNQESV